MSKKKLFIHAIIMIFTGTSDVDKKITLSKIIESYITQHKINIICNYYLWYLIIWYLLIY